MITFLRIFAYICIWTTPFQVGFVLWGIGIVALTDYTVLSLSNIEFIRNYVSFFIPLVDWLYTWFWNTLLDWLFSLPIILHGTLKSVFTTLLGLWILKYIKK